MSRLQAIESALLSINDAVFQELCDSYLVLRNRNYSAFSRTGTQSGKQKTVKGTPDSFFLLPNGRYVFVEYSTNVTKGVSKLEKDVQKCLDESKTKIPIDEIEELILCVNFRLTTVHVQKLMRLLEGTGITLTLLSLDSLSKELYLHHSDLIAKYLGLPFDTGQIQPLNNFISAYNNAAHNISTPLDNPFSNRQNELRDFVETLSSKNLIVLTGPGGVGKTKLAIEGIKQFLSINPDYQAYAVLNKDADILEDLYINFSKESKSILFIDDVNRFGRISQVIGFCKSSGKNLKVILTVRDYALGYIQNNLSDIKYSTIKVSLFKKEEILEIIKNPPFQILNSSFQKKILAIANGNARLAVMASKLALDKQDIEALSDVSDLFDAYFSTFLRDQGNLKNVQILKTLGLLSFFYTIPYNNEELLNEMCKIFEISHHNFIDSIEILRDLEFVEINYGHVKISDQTLSTYYFYKVFLKDKQLSLKTLLTHYFKSNKNKFRDTFYPAVNAFNFNKVKELSLSDLKEYFKSLMDDESLTFEFLKMFWFYLSEETLEHVIIKINTLPVTSPIAYNTQYNSNDYLQNKEPLLGLLKNFYSGSNYLKEALELSFEYVRKTPDNLPELIKNIDQGLIYHHEDSIYGFYRQKILFEILERGILRGDVLLIKVFIAISPNFLKFKLQYSEPGWGNTISLYTYPLELNDATKELRKQIWKLLTDLFPQYEEEILKVLIEHSSRSPDVLKEIFEYDLHFILPFVETRLEPTKFLHCFYVIQLIDLALEHDIILDKFQGLKERFRSDSYIWFETLSWEYHRGKESYKIRDWREFEKLKERDIKKTFSFKDPNEFTIFFSFVMEVYKYLTNRFHRFQDSLDLILEEEFKKNKFNAFLFFIHVIKSPLIKEIRVLRSISIVANDLHLRNSFFDELSRDSISYNIALSILSAVPKDQVDEIELRRVFKSIKSIDTPLHLWLECFEKYQQIDSQFYEKILSMVLEKNKSQEVKITIDSRFFGSHLEYISDLKVIQQNYLQQDELQNDFDYNGQGLLEIVRRDESFLLNYITFIFKTPGYKSHKEYDGLSIIWKLENSPQLIITCFKFFCNIRKGILHR